jgi:hypothetical protein
MFDEVSGMSGCAVIAKNDAVIGEFDAAIGEMTFPPGFLKYLFIFM